MGDLEDAILKKNVPGRYSSWCDEEEVEEDEDDDDEDDDGSDDDDDDDEHYFRDHPRLHPLPHPRNHRTTKSSSSSSSSSSHRNTGVKGVLADYRIAMEDGGMEEEGYDHSEYDEYDNDNDDDDGCRTYHRQSSYAIGGGHRHGRGRGLSYAVPEEYVDLVDAMSDDDALFLVVYLFDPTAITTSSSSSRCRAIRTALDDLAREDDGEHAIFVEVDAKLADPNLDTICLPALLIYRRGALLHNLVRFDDDLPRTFGVDELRVYLEGLGIPLGVGEGTTIAAAARHDRDDF